MTQKRGDILIMTPIFPPQTGGAAIYFELLTLELSKRSDISSLTLLTTMNGVPSIHSEGKLTVLRVIPPLVSGNIFKAGFTYIMQQLAFLATLPLIALFRSPDIVHVHTNLVTTGPRDAPILRFLMRSIKGRTVLDVRGFNTPKNMDFADGIIYVSEDILHAIPEKYRERATHVPVPVKQPEVADQNPAENLKPYICFLGALRAEKGVYRLLDAFKLVQEEKAELNLVYAGKLRDKEFTNSIQEENSVHYLGELPHNEAMAVLKGSELLVLPSESEGFPRVCLEAFTLDRTVLCPKSIKELTDEMPQNVLKSLDPYDMADDIHSALSKNWKSSYPMDQHSIDAVTDRTVDTYFRN